MIKKVGIINYGAGNLKSITKAINILGFEVEILERNIPKDIDMLVLPGVGNFGAAMRKITSYGIDEQIIKFVKLNRPLLGICLGIQLLFDKSEEAPNMKGLGILNGKVVKFKKIKLPIPHMCWNVVEFVKENTLLLDGLNKKEYFYFVHSYYVVPKDKNIVFGVTNYSNEFCSMIVDGNIVATQFHLEKSGPKGLKLLKNIFYYLTNYD